MEFNSAGTTQSLYIHWPFCPYKCHFCPFVALASHEQFMEQYHHALKAEVIAFGKTGDYGSIKTIHLGGGTPSLYPDSLLLDMFAILKNTFRIQKKAEIAIEVNPGTVRDEQLLLWRDCGINRLSIGVQSLKDSVLKKLNRHQTASQVHDLLCKAEPYFNNISVDFILGLPDVLPEDWKKLVVQAMQWPIKHISIYFLSVHTNTPLYFKVKANQISLPTDEQVVALYEWTCDTLAQHNFVQYELSNFARPGYESRHNSAYWDRKPYKGFGIGACSFDGKRRFENEKNIMKYIKAIDSDQKTERFTEELSMSQVRLECLMLGLRRPCGVVWHDVVKGLSHEKKQYVNYVAHSLEKKGLLERNQGRIRLTMQGLAVENEIITQLFN